jgi:hypothetical protein
VPEGLKAEDMQEEELVEAGSGITVVRTAPRKGISNFWGNLKTV